MKLLAKYAGWFGLCALASAYPLFLGAHLHATRAGIGRLQSELSDTATVRIENDRLRELLAQSEELDDLRHDNAEMSRLRRQIAELREQLEKRKRDAARSVRDQVTQLQAENLRLRDENVQLEQASAGARQSVDSNELMEIGQALGMYAKINSAQMPDAIADLKSYVPADIFPTFETNRFEFVYRGRLTDITDTANTPLVRSKFKDNQNARAYLFADGHVAARQE